MIDKRKQNKAIKFYRLPVGNYFEVFSRRTNPPSVYKKVEPFGTPKMRGNTIPRLWLAPNTWIIEVKK